MKTAVKVGHVQPGDARFADEDREDAKIRPDVKPAAPVSGESPQ
jgi:hypothetical protein